MFARGLKSRCERLAIEHRRTLNLAPHDPLPAKALAESLRIRVYDPTTLTGISAESLRALRNDQGSWSAATVRMGDHAAIVVNPDHSPARQSSDLMHELAHLILGHQPSQFQVSREGPALLTEYEKQQEDEADWLAGCLLLPRPALVRIRSRGMDEATVSELFGCSIRMLRYRVSVTGVDYQMRAARNKQVG